MKKPKAKQPPQSNKPRLSRRQLIMPGVGELHIHDVPGIRELWQDYPQGLLPLLAAAFTMTITVAMLVTSNGSGGGYIVLTGVLYAAYRSQQIRLILQRHPKRCVSCGYRRDGLQEFAACPECGTVPLPGMPVADRGTFPLDNMGMSFMRAVMIFAIVIPFIIAMIVLIQRYW